MLTLAKALTASEFHYGECKRTVGPRGGVTLKIEAWRRSGKTKTWKTAPTRYEIPVKHGLYNHAYVRDSDRAWHTADECPLNARDERDAISTVCDTGYHDRCRSATCACSCHTEARKHSEENDTCLFIRDARERNVR